MLLSIIIVNYKTPQLTLKCIQSIKNTLSVNVNYEIIVVDNFSEDNSKEFICSKYSEILWISNSYNLGFGRANNVGIKHAKGSFILFINSDVVVLENSIHECLKTIRQDPSIGILGCTLLNPDNTVQKSTFHIASYKNLLNKNLIIDKFCPLKENKEMAIMGAFMIIPKAVLNRVGLFDPDFFMYCEELELSKRVLDSGYKIKQNLSCSVIHNHGSSSSNTWSIQQRFVSNALLFYKVKQLWLYLLISIFNTLTNAIFMWFIDSKYRKSFFESQKLFYKNYHIYLKIPFKYRKKIGVGDRMLKLEKTIK